MRLATFNLENLDERSRDAPPLEERIAVLRPQLERLRADVLCLQEVNARKPEGDRKAPRLLRALDALFDGTEYRDYHRCVSTLPDGRGPLDVQNLVIASRRPIAYSRQYWHDLVTPPDYAPATADPPAETALPVRWDRPALHAAIDIGDGRLLHVINLHLRAPLAAVIAGQKEDAFTWKTVSGWAEGFYMATIKRAGQALEARRAVDALFDAEPDALIAVCGDMNAEAREVPLRILRGETEDTANGALAGRSLVALERAVPESVRYTVMHAGQPLMLDHLLASRSLAARVRGIEVHNEALQDEVIGYATIHRAPDSFHAPVVAEFELDEG